MQQKSIKTLIGQLEALITEDSFLCIKEEPYTPQIPELFSGINSKMHAGLSSVGYSVPNYW